MPPSIRVLHVDDEPGFADLTADFLERQNDRIVVMTETDADDALARLRSESVDCVVSDHDMPSMSGIELLESVRETHPDLPFILFTGKGSEAVASKAVSAGVTDYLQKERGTDQYTILANRIENAVERFRSKRSARERKRRLETLISNLPGVVYRCRNEPGWPMEYIEGECEDLTGYPADAVESGEVRWGEDVVHPDDREEVWREVQEAVESGHPFECTYRIVTADGGTKWLWERGRLVDPSDGDAAALEGFLTDITESKERERRFEAIFNNTYQFTGLMEPDGTLIEANEPALEFGGLDRDEVVGKPLWEADWFRSNERARRVARDAVETAHSGDLYRAEITVQGTDGEAVIDFSVRPVTDEDGNVTLLIPEGRDITELKERERELRRTERQFEAVFNDPNLLVGLLDPDGTVRDVNRTAMEYVDADRSDVVGEPFPTTPWWRDDLRDDLRGWIEEAATEEYVEYETTHPTTGDRSLAVEGSLRPVTDDDGCVTAIVVSARDVTERRRQNRELKRRNDRLDEFTSFVSHDLKTPISTVEGRLELALETGEMEHVERAVEAIDRVDDLRADLVDTLRSGEVVSGTEPVGLARIFERVWATVDPPATASYAVADPVEVEADPDALWRLLENLVGNSVEHGGDEVAVRVGRTDDGFYYEDDGPGIATEHREQVFTPGFSTKDDEGIGMGMASVRQIVLAHDWEIRVEEGRSLGGARFEIDTR